MDDKVPEKEDAVPIANHVDWTQDEERAAVRRLKWIVMPMMLAGFYALQLDRGNISGYQAGSR